MKSRKFLIIIFIIAETFAYRDMLRNPTVRSPKGNYVIDIFQIKKMNCKYMRDIYDLIIDVFAKEYENYRKNKDGDALSRFFGKIFNGAMIEALNAQVKAANEKLKDIFENGWDFDELNNHMRLGEIIGSSVYHQGHQCLHVSQLWIMMVYLQAQELIADRNGLMTDVLANLYDSDEVLFEINQKKRKLTFADYERLDKDNVFKDFVMFMIGSMVPECEDLLFAIYRSSIDDKHTLIEQVVQLNDYMIKDQKAFAERKSQEEKEKYWRNLFKDIGEASAFLGLYILDVVSKKVVGEVHIVGGILNEYVTSPINKFIVELTKKYFDGTKPKEIENFEFHLHTAFAGKTINFETQDAILYEMVQGNIKCKHCQNHFFNLMGKKYINNNGKTHIV